MTERRALLIAGTAHLALLAALSLALEATHRPLPVPDQAEPVEFVQIAERVAVTTPPQPTRKAAPQQATPAPTPPATPPAKPATPPADPVPEPPTPTLPRPAPPKPTPDKSAPDKPAPPKPAPPKPAPAKPAPAKPVPALDATALSSLIDKTLPKAPRKSLDTSALAKSIDQALPRTTRVDPRATATLSAAIRAQIFPCWNPPIGGADVRRMTVTLHVEFARDGSVAARPEVAAQTGATADNAGYARSFADTARRAVLRCAPLKLPAELYDQWKSVDINFDPSAMV